MTRYVLRDDLSYCRIDRRLVFLDIGNDRYFQLPQAMEQTLAAYLDGADCAPPDVLALVERALLIERPPAATGSRADVQTAARSAMEAPPSQRHVHARELMQVVAIVLRTRIALRFSTLKNILDSLVADRRRQSAQAVSRTHLSEQQIADAAAVFRRARLYVPIGMRCLLDAIALTRFLSGRRIHAHVVFGVALDPFSAHCWVQVGDLVLNDTVGNVAAHTPIRVV